MGAPPRRVRIPDEVADLIRRMHPELKRKVRDSLKIIMTSPNEGKALQDELADLRSFRVGRFRIIYRLHRNTVEIITIGPRERIYEDTYRLIK
jgi:mRNA interferase RelE/StbE